MQQNLTLCVCLAATAMLVGCEGAPTRPTPTANVALATAVPPAAAPVWPVSHPDGQYGHEDPRYPPAEALCPVEYWPHYNGWNWLCEGRYSWLREFPSTRWRGTEAGR